MMAASLALILLAGPKAEPADVLIARAAKESVKGDRRILVQFGASWCVPCHKLEKLLSEGKVGRIVGKYFVLVHLDLYEKPEKANLMNPGADTLIDHYGGKNSGIPFWVIVDKDGKLLATGEGAPEGYTSIPPFLRTLVTGNPKMSTDDLWTIRREMEAKS